MQNIKLIRFGIFLLFSLLYSAKDLKTRYVEDYLFALGIFFELISLLFYGWEKFATITFQALATYLFLLISLILWLKFRKKIPFGLADVKYLTFLTAYKGIIFAYLSLTFSIPLIIAYYGFRKIKKQRSIKYLPYIPFLFLSSLIALIFV